MRDYFITKWEFFIQREDSQYLSWGIWWTIQFNFQNAGQRYLYLFVNLSHHFLCGKLFLPKLENNKNASCTTPLPWLRHWMLSLKIKIILNHVSRSDEWLFWQPGHVKCFVINFSRILNSYSLTKPNEANWFCNMSKSFGLSFRMPQGFSVQLMYRAGKVKRKWWHQMTKR